MPAPGDRDGNAEEEALLAAIAADVDSPDPRLVYADWLQQRGDPRGELAIAQHRYAQAPNEQLRARVSELESALASELLAPLTHRDILGGWWLGFIDGLMMHRRLFALGAQLPPWLDRIPLRFVRTLHLAVSDPAAWRVIERWPHRGHVQSLRYGNTENVTSVASLGRARQLLSSVRTMHLSSARVPVLAPVADLQLRSLRIDVDRLEIGDLDHVYSCKWPLESFALRCKHFEPNAARERVAAVLRPVLAGEQLASVRRLEVEGLPAVPIVEGLVESGRIDTIESLALDFAYHVSKDRARLVELAPRLMRVRIEFPVTEHYRDRRTGHALARLLDEMNHPDAIERYERVPFQWNEQTEFRQYASALYRRGGKDQILAAIDRIKRTTDWRRPLVDESIMMFARVVLELEAPGSELWQQMKLVVARGLLLYRQFDAAIELVKPLRDDDSIRLVRALAYRELGDAAGMTEAVSQLAASRDVVYRALAGLVADRFDDVVPRHAIDSRAIVAALEPADAVTDEQHLDCAEIAIYAAYRVGDRSLAAARLRALLDELGVGVRPWNHDLRAAFGVLPIVESARRAFVEVLVRALRTAATREHIERLVECLESGPP